MAHKFAQWTIGSEGQNFITDFKINNKQLHIGAPANLTAQL
jgi:ABC-type tungstate transport system permease subunit